MIRLDQNKLRNMYPEMTEEFSDRMHRMVHTLPLQKEERQVKRISFCTVVTAVLICVSITTAMAAGLFFSPRMDAVMVAEDALELEYGITQEMLTYFHRETEKLPDGSYLVTYEGIEQMEVVLGKYSIVVRDKNAAVQWSHDGMDTAGGLDALAWGSDQLNEMIRIHKETHSSTEYVAKAQEIAEKQGAQPAESMAVNVLTEQEYEAEQTALASESKLSVPEMEVLAREAVQMVYALSDDQVKMMVYVPEMSCFNRLADGKLCYAVNLQLVQAQSEDPTEFAEYTQGDGIYTITVNAESGEIESILYESNLYGNG